MKRLSSYETHTLIKKHVPNASTFWEQQDKKESQLTFDFFYGLTVRNKPEQWKIHHRELKTIDQELYNSFKRNIERRA